MAKILVQVSVTKREQEIKLDEEDFDEKRRINKRKKLIESGLEPEEADRQIESELEWKRKRREAGGGQKGKKKRKKGKGNDEGKTTVASTSAAAELSD